MFSEPVLGVGLREALLAGAVDRDEVVEIVAESRRVELEAGLFSAWVHNQRVLHWCGFFAWAALRTAWVRGAPHRDVRKEIASDAPRKARIEAIRGEIVERVGRQTERLDDKAFNADELAALRDAVHIPEAEWCTASLIDFRDYCIFLVLRYGGLRRGELLSVKVDCLPRRDSLLPDALRVTTEIMGQAPRLRVPRNQDDADDPRLEEPSTKRFGRDVPMPGAALRALWVLVDRFGLRDDEYLIRSTTGDRPLSVKQAGSRVSEAYRKAAKVFEARHEGVPHTFSAQEDNNSHRLRHTLAEEHAERLYEAGASHEEAAEELLRIFGWRSIDSGQPYLQRFYRRTAEQLRRQHLEAILVL